MFGIGMPELLVILVVALVLLGPKRLPEVAKVLGKAMGEFRKATAGINEELESARVMLEEEARKATTEAARSIAPPKPPANAAPRSGVAAETPGSAESSPAGRPSSTTTT